MERNIGGAELTMLADTKAMVHADVDVAPLVGTWLNAKRDTDHITRVVVSERDGAVLVRLYGSAMGESIDWGEVRARLYAHTGTRAVAGFHAAYELGATRIEIAANVKQGILVIQTYTSFSDGSGRLSQFSREFFHRSPGERAGRVVQRGVPFLDGDWVNTHPDTEWIKEFSLMEKGDTRILRVRAVREPSDWGEAEVTTYLDAAGDPAFHASYDLRPFEAKLAGNTGKDIVIIAAYVRFKDSARDNAFIREFFVPR